MKNISVIISESNVSIAGYVSNNDRVISGTVIADIIPVHFRLMGELEGLVMGDIYPLTMRDLYVVEET